MKIKFIQNFIDLIRGKHRNLKVPKMYKEKVFMLEKGGILAFDYKTFNYIVNYNKSANISLFYNKLDTWSLKDYYEERFNRQMKFVKEKFAPLIKETDEICDVGCASGDFTFEFAKYCKEVDGYEMSSKMVDWANNYAKENNISNVKFYQGMCESINYQKQYDKMSFMGVLTYVMEDDKAETAVKKIYDALKPGGYLIYKDNSNETDNNFYFFGPSPDYKMIARSKKNILELFEKTGFKVVNEDVFHRLKFKNTVSNKDEEVELISLGLILQKPI